MIKFIQTVCLKPWNCIQSLKESRALRIAIFIWAVYGGIVGTIVAIQPERRTVTPVYQKASENWWQGEKSLYRGESGYLYLPQFAVLYSPYTILPTRLREPLWRLTGIGLLATALWLACVRLASGHSSRLFLASTILALPSSFSSARNGQVNLPFAALLILSALALARQRWWTTAILLGVMLVMKPIALAPMLVFCALYPRLRIPTIVVVIAVAGLPFVHPHPQYVAAEYIRFFKNLQPVAFPHEFAWCDFSGIFHCLGTPIPTGLKFLIRVVAGLVTLLLAYRAMRAVPPSPRTLLIAGLCAIYLMLFNPRTETNSYVILGGFVALGSAYAGIVLRKMYSATGLACIALFLGSENFGNPIFPWTNFWLKPLLTLVLGIVLTWWLVGVHPANNRHSNTLSFKDV